MSWQRAIVTEEMLYQALATHEGIGMGEFFQENGKTPHCTIGWVMAERGVTEERYATAQTKASESVVYPGDLDINLGKVWIDLLGLDPGLDPEYANKEVSSIINQNDGGFQNKAVDRMVRLLKEHGNG